VKQRHTLSRASSVRNGKLLPGAPKFEHGFPLAELELLLADAKRGGIPPGAVFQVMKDESQLDRLILGRFVWEADASDDTTGMEGRSMPVSGDITRQ
jgi:hypothetical protein